MTVSGPPGSTRTYAHVRAFDLACPDCGRVDAVGLHTAKRGATVRGIDAGGYDPLRAAWRCPSCRRVWYVGLILWAVTHRPGRPPDHVPTLEQARALRLQLGWVREGTAPARAEVNAVCTCGHVCAVHGTRAPGLPPPTNDEDDV